MGESIYKLIREKNKASFLTLKILVINLSCSRNILADEPKIAGNNPTSIEKTTTCHEKKKFLEYPPVQDNRRNNCERNQLGVSKVP